MEEITPEEILGQYQQEQPTYQDEEGEPVCEDKEGE